MASDREWWGQVRSLFDELVQLDPPQRGARLEEIGRADPELRDAVKRLLSADTGAESLLKRYEFGSGEPAPAPLLNSRDPLGVIGHTVGHFRIAGYLAAGGMGVVYTAEDLRLGRVVALKFPLPNQTLARAARERFANEARSAAALDHPNLCAVYEVGETEHGVFLAMPLYPGETLKDLLSREGALPPERALGIFAQVTSGVASAHAAGIVHRDLKPANIMILPDGTAKVLDFGLAKIRDVSLTKSQMTLGTIGYIAPEQIRSAAGGAQADLWSIGVMLYEVLTGRQPFAGEHEVSIMHAVLHTEAPPPSAVRPSLPPAFDRVVGALLQKDPADRYKSADDLLVDLAALQRGAPLSHRTPFMKRTPRRRKLQRGALPIAAAVTLIAGVSWLTYARTSSAGPAGSLRWRNNVADVRTAEELAAALVPANAGRTVRLRAGTYDIHQPLSVPEGMVIAGAGTMRFDAEGRPSGFAEGTQPVLRMLSDGGGDMITLGNGVTVRNVEIVDLAGRSGNVVAVLSRRPEDSVSATIQESVIVNPNPLAIGPGGSLGRSLFIITRNPNSGSDPAPDTGSVLAVRVVGSVIRSPSGGGGFFAYNFAAGSRISVDISQSVIGGGNEANGGVSRPDAVHDSEVRLISRGNLYRNEWADRCASALIGWNLTGGSGPPIPMRTPATTRNRLQVHSTDDRLEGFTTAVLATGTRRFFAEPLQPPPSDNHIDLTLLRTSISTPDCPVGSTSNTVGVPAARLRVVADLRLAAATVENETLFEGHGNTLRAQLRGVSGSGKRRNTYDQTRGAGPLPAQRLRSTNRLLIAGDSATFVRENRGIEPPPSTEFFTGRR